MEKVFQIRTEPHRAVIGDVTLLLVPESNSADFLDAYNRMRMAQELFNKKSGGKAKGSEVDTESLVQLSGTMRDFLARFLLPESVQVFESMTLPDRILLQLIEFVAELYGGGSGNPDADGGTSSD